MLLLMKRADSKYVCSFWKVLRKSVWRAFPNLVLPGKMVWENRISHPDCVKICVDHNGRINLRAKQKYEVLSATHAFEKVNISRNPSGDKIEKNSTAVESLERYIQCTKFSRKVWIKRYLNLLITGKIFWPLEKRNKSVVDKKRPCFYFRKLCYERTKNPYSKLCYSDSHKISYCCKYPNPEKLGAENWIFAFYVLAHDIKVKAVQEILISYSFNVTNVKLIDRSLPYASTKQWKITPLPFRRYTPIWNYQNHHIICL